MGDESWSQSGSSKGGTYVSRGWRWGEEEEVVVGMGGGGFTSHQTELSFTNPLTESSCNESWLAGL